RDHVRAALADLSAVPAAAALDDGRLGVGGGVGLQKVGSVGAVVLGDDRRAVLAALDGDGERARRARVLSDQRGVVVADLMHVGGGVAELVDGRYLVDAGLIDLGIGAARADRLGDVGQGARASLDHLRFDVIGAPVGVGLLVVAVWQDGRDRVVAMLVGEAGQTATGRALLDQGLVARARLADADLAAVSVLDDLGVVIRTGLDHHGLVVVVAEEVVHRRRRAALFDGGAVARARLIDAGDVR